MTKQSQNQNIVLSMQHVKKVFGAQVALDHVSFDIFQGEIFGFLGPSGAGKTTTVNLFSGQLMPTAGQVRVLGQDVIDKKNPVFSHMGVLSDSVGLYSRLSLYDNLILMAKLHKVSKAHVLKLIERLGLIEHMKKPLAQFSKGMHQRVMIAAALLHSPKILFLDEPTASLDPRTTREIHTILKELNSEGTTLFLTTHDMTEADKLCHRVAFLNEGQIVDMGSPTYLKGKYASDEIRITLKDGQEVIHHKDASAVRDITQWLTSGHLDTIHSMEPTLETIFLNLTGKELNP